MGKISNKKNNIVDICCRWIFKKYLLFYTYTLMFNVVSLLINYLLNNEKPNLKGVLFTMVARKRQNI